MEKFIVSARKYRPQTFDPVIGQSHITTTLMNAIKNDQLAHAFLFCGPRGVGKTTCARILAKTINCEARTSDGEACNTCNSCISFDAGTSLNIHELDAASNNSVDDIRNLVEQVRFAPQAGKYKVYIIDEVHMLSSSAFNAFLKTLEEPPPYAIFILATTEKHKILPTILSRCQIFDFKRITLNDTVEHLYGICEKEHIKADKAALQVISQKSEGCMRDALSIMDKIVSFTNGELNYGNTLEHLNILDADYFFQFLEFMQKQDLGSSLLLFDDINKKGFEGDMLLNGFAEFCRNLLVCKDEKVASLLEVVESFREKYTKAAKSCSASWLISALNLLNESEINYKTARNKRLHIEMTLIKLTYLLQAIEFASEPEGGLAKKKNNESLKPIAFRKLQPISFKEIKPATGSSSSTIPSQARLVVETPGVQQKEVLETAPIEAPIHKPVASPVKSPTLPNSTTIPAVRTKLGKLGDLRQQVAHQQKLASQEEIKVLTEESLRTLWERYTIELRTLKNPASQSFELAKLRLLSDIEFEVVCSNNLEQKFIEQERSKFSEQLIGQFNNRQIQYNILIEEAEVSTEPVDRPLNTKEQFLKIAEEYPLVRELRDKLRLDLDF